MQLVQCTILVNYCDNNDKVCSSPPGCRPTAATLESLEPVRNARSGKYVEGYSDERSGADDFILILARFKYGSNEQIKRRETVAQKLIVIVAEYTFCLHWNDFQNIVLTSFWELRHNRDFTLALVH